MSNNLSDVLSLALVKAMTSKMATYVNQFSQKLNDTHSIDPKEVVDLWNETNKEIKIKFKKEDPSKEKKIKNTCPYVAQAGKNKGVACGKRCKGEFCSSHLPEKLEKEKQKREAKKAEEQTNKGKEDKKSSKKQKEEDETDSDTSDVSDSDDE